MKEDWAKRLVDQADNQNYRRFTGPQELDRAFHTLEGLLKGIAADREITEQEVEGVRQWMAEHADRAAHHPFNEFIPYLDDVLADGRIDAEEARDILWLCDRMSTSNEYYDDTGMDG